eukprot:4713208-Amphidinium_carterae.4
MLHFGKQGHTSTFCYHNKGKSGKGQNKGQQSSYYSQQPGKGYPQSPPYQQQYYSQSSTPQYPPSTSQPPKGYTAATVKAIGNIGTKEARKVN